MGWLEPISTAVTAASLASELVRSSGHVRKYWARICYWVRNGSLVIPFFGAGGVGKTTLGRMITGACDPLDVLAPYDESWTVEPIELGGDIPGFLIIAPGQVDRVERHWPRLFDRVTAGEAKGVINVVSYGYHSLAIHSYREHDLFQDGMDQDQFFAKYAEERRKLEVSLLERLVAGISTAGTRLWVLTIVNKQDLWWQNRTEVKDHYCSGEYGKILKALESKLGVQNFQHEYLPVSLAIGNLATQSGEILAENAKGYGQAHHLRSLDLLFRRVFELGIEAGL